MPADVLVLGAGGTFGHVATTMLSKRYDVVRAARRPSAHVVEFDALGDDHHLRTLLRKVHSGGMVVNTVAILASAIQSAADHERAVATNSLFPHRLARLASENDIRVVHISTDAVFPRMSGAMSEADPIGPEDCYAVTKAAGEPLDLHCITLRCSIIGPPAPGRQRGLWAWIASQPPGATIRGYVNQAWAGLTTKQLATTCANLVEIKSFSQVRAATAILHVSPNPVVSKLDIVQILSRAIRPDLTVEAGSADIPITRTLRSRYAAFDRLTPRYPAWADAVAAAITPN